MSCEFEWADWPAVPGVHAAFSLRVGGVSRAPFDSLNLGIHVGDGEQAVIENRRRLRMALNLPAEPLWLDQVHGALVLDADAFVPAGLNDRPRADAAVSSREGVVLAIQVADCMPVLLCSDDGQLLGAAHAGWRGLAAGVVRATVAAMQVPGARLLAWLGPAIGAEAFEVGDDVRDTFLAREPQAAQAFRRNARARWQCDLEWLVRRELAGCGVTRVYGGARCTVSDPKRYFSHRRDGRSGRMAALLWRERCG